MFLPILIQKKKPFFGTEIPEKGIKQGLPRSIADFGRPHLLYEILIYWSAAQ